MSRKFCDIGVNLTNKRFRDVPQVLDRALGAGVTHIVLTGTSAKSSLAAQRLVSAHRSHAVRLAFTSGCHPHDAASCDKDGMAEIRRLAASACAVGEAGLDYNRMFSPAEDQIRVFEAQLALAKELRKPLFLHQRDAHEPFMEVMKRFTPFEMPVVIHCFTGSLDEVQDYLALDPNIFIGFTGFVCDEREGRGAHLGEVVQAVPVERMMVETDAPFILPRTMPRKEQKACKNRCEPMHITYVLQKLAEMRGIDPTTPECDAFANTLFQTSMDIFFPHSADKGKQT